MFDFTNKTIMITGAIGQLGAALTQSFQAANANLALVDRGEDRLKKAFPDLVGLPDNLLVDCADLMDEAAVEHVVSKAVNHFGGLDVLVNTVGGFRAGKMLHETPLETWDSLLNLNARSVFIACRQVIPHMLNEGSGKIVNIAARPGLTGQPGLAAYSAAKSAVVRLTESMSAELKDQGINVNCIIPGTIDTPGNREAMPEADFSTWVTPDSLAEVILFLSSSAARDIHGAALPVYGRS
ncbi:MAG: SDR family NAD(P)-dependent oxidoreductase [Chloroflexota bacterium]|nr:MAG: SDR family NAD(P)-dependent oxidoreductase [Chloroflexota bacterium]